MYLYCYELSEIRGDRYPPLIIPYLLNLKNNQFFDITNKKKIVIDEDKRAKLHLATSYTFVQDSILSSLFSEKGFYATCENLDNKNYCNSPLSVIGYRIQNSTKSSIMMTDFNANSIFIAFRVRSLDDRVDQNIDYYNLKFKNSI